MRFCLAVLISLVMSSAFDTARADPYRWCAEYGVGIDGGATNCYFITLQQCQWAISGNGGFCRPNLFYDGRPVVTPGDMTPRAKKKSPQRN